MLINEFAVYILTNKVNTVFYTGITSDLFNRILQHKQKTFKGFTAKYDCNKLVYFEQFQWIQDAIDREKQISRIKTKENRYDLERKSRRE